MSCGFPIAKELATFDFAPGRPNSFRFIYHPSDVEPFDIPAFALDSLAQTFEVEVGTASAKLQRVTGRPSR